MNVQRWFSKISSRALPKRKRDDDDGDVSLQGDEEDSRSSGLTKVEPPKG